MSRLVRSTINDWRTLFIILIALLLTSAPARAGLIELYDYYGGYSLETIPPDVRPIILDVPDQFFYRPPYRAANKILSPRKAWDINLLTYYPSFTSPSDPINSKYGLSCAGICNGRILIYVANRSRGVGTRYPNMGEAIAQSDLKSFKDSGALPYARVETLSSSGTWFDAGFKLHLLNAAGDYIAPIELLYLVKDDPSSSVYGLTATCRMNSERTTCVLHFSADCVPGLYISVNGLDGSYLSNAREIRKNTNSFLALMIRSPSCSG